METPDLQEQFERLKEEVARLHAVLDNVNAYVYTKDKEGRYTYANRKVRELFGLPLEGIAGSDDSRFFDLSKSDELRTNDRLVLESGVLVEREEANVVASSGEVRMYWTAKLPLRDSGGAVTGLCGISTDITDRKRVERELQANRQLLDSVLSNVDAHVYMKDREYRYLYVNAKVAENFGLPSEAILGKTDEELQTTETLEQFRRLDSELFRSGRRQQGEEKFSAADGTVRYYWSIKVPLVRDGLVDAFIGFSTDITDLHNLQEEREKLIGELRQALDRIKALRGLIPICSSCKRIREDSGYWNQIEDYLSSHSDAEFSHGLCPECAKALYPGWYQEDGEEEWKP